MIDLQKKEVIPQHIYYVDTYGMMCQRNFGGDEGRGDALWRTSISYMIFKNHPDSKILLDGIKSCFIKINNSDGSYYYQVYRHPNVSPIDTSRDQVNAAIACLYIAGEHELAIEYASNLKYSLSPKFNQTLDFYFWLKTLTTTGNLKQQNIKIYSFISTIMANFVVFWNRSIRFLGGFKTKDALDFKSNNDNLNKWQKILAKIQFPTYAFFLWVLQILTLPKGEYRTSLSMLLLEECEDTNLALRLLLNDDSLIYVNLDKYVSFYGLRFNSRLDDTMHSGFRPMTDEEKQVNDLDYYFLKFAIEYKNKFNE